MKKIASRLLLLITSFFLLITSTNLPVVAQEIVDEVVNLGVVLEITSEKDTVLSGEIHKVRIKNSYANPNDEDYATCKIYLTDENGSPNNAVMLQGLVENRIVFSCENNDDLSVVVELKEDKTDNKVTARYLEYTLQPGTSYEMELEFLVPNGLGSKEETLMFLPKITHELSNEGKIHENDKMTQGKTIKWTSEFLWDNLQKKSSTQTLAINSNNKLAKDITYNFSVNNNNSGEYGNIWTNRITITDTLTLPEGLTLPTDITYSENNKQIYSGEQLLYEINLPEELSVANYSIDELNATGNKIKFVLTMNNPNYEDGTLKADFNPINGIRTTLYSEPIIVQDGYVFSGEEKINNSVQAVFVPYSQKADSLTLNATNEVTIEEDTQKLVLTKTADVQDAYKGDIINYTITMQNTGRVPINSEMVDTMPEGIIITEQTKEELEGQGYTISEEETYVIRKNINLNVGESQTLTFSATVATDDIGIRTNRVTYGGSQKSATVNVNKNALQLEKKQIRKWKNYSKNNYSREFSWQQNYPMFDLLGEGDRIEYEITLRNNTNEEKEQVVLYDEIPEMNTMMGYFGVLKLYLAGEEGTPEEVFERSDKHTDFIKNLVRNGSKDPTNKKTIIVNIPAKTTLHQTFILDIPEGEDYTKFLDGLRYSLGYINSNQKEEATEKITNLIYIDQTDISSKVYHKVEPRYFVQKGVLARNEIDAFELGIAFARTDDNLNKYYYYENGINDEEVITFYSYFVNDSFYNLDLSKTNIVDYLSPGLEFLGLNTIETQMRGYVDGLVTEVNAMARLSNVTRQIKTRANSIPVLFVNDKRGTGPYNVNGTYPRNQQGFESDSITVTVYGGSKLAKFDVQGTLAPGQGFYILYSCKVKQNEVSRNQKINNTIVWDLVNTNGYLFSEYGIRKSDAISVDTFYNSMDPNLKNNGKCNTKDERTLDGSIFNYGSSPSLLWSEVQLEPETVYGTMLENRYGNIFIKKVDDTGEEIKLGKDDIVKFKILNKDMEPLNFTEKTVGNSTYLSQYAGKYYWYEKSSTETTVTELTSNARISIKNLPAGKYYIQELQAPNYFQKTDQLIEFQISDNPSESDSIYDSDFRPLYALGKGVAFKNQYTGKREVYIEKVDSERHQPITSDEAKFSVYKSRDTNTDPIEFVKTNVVDEKGNHYRLATPEDSEKTTELITNQGKIQIDNLEYKTYYIKEVQAPFGYKKDSSYKSVTLKPMLQEDISQKVTFENTKNINDITITKTDEEGTLIKSDTAKFQLYDSDENIVKVKELTRQENNSLYEVGKNEGEELVDTIETYNGKIVIKNLELGEYKLKEVKAPQGYEIAQKEIDLDIANVTDTYNFEVKNGRNYGNINIVKTTTEGETIETNNTVFKLYKEDNTLVRLAYNDEETEEGRVYHISKDETQNTYTQLTTYNGKIKIQDIPIGNYYLKEIVAPAGYSLNDENIPLKVEPLNCVTPLTVEVPNAEYKFGQEEHVSTSYQKIEEKDKNSNFGYGYYGKEADYEGGNYNYIVVDGKDDIVTYTLKVINVSKKNYENLVLINKLPDVGDTGAVNLSQQRNSQFTIKLAQNPNFELVLYDKDGEEKVLTKGKDYTIDFSNNVQYTNNDWNGVDSQNWYSNPTQDTKSFRIKFAEDFELYPGYSIALKFDGNIQNNAEPGKIAWNSFGYRYYVGDISLTPEPPKVGVKIPFEPVITKTMTDNSNGTYHFDVYEQGKEEKITTIEVQAGTSSVIPAKRTINGETTGYLEDGKTYIIKEQANNVAKLSNIVGQRGEVKESSFEFTYDNEQEIKAEFINEPLKDGNIILTKVDKETKAHLANAKFKLLNADNQTIKVKKVEQNYVIANNEEQGSVEELITDASGEIRITNLPFGTYKLKEVEAPHTYRTDTETIHTIEINSDDYRIENGVAVNIPETLEVSNEIIRGKVIVHHYIEGTDTKVPSKNGGQVQDSTIEDVIDEHYTTEISDEIAPNYEYVKRTENYEGTIKEATQEVTYYYNYKEPGITNSIAKTGTQTITSKGEAVQYKIRYNAEVDIYKGNAVITIVDTLPYHIDKAQSQLKDGQYDENKKTITWTENVEGINTFEEGKFTKLIEKDITVVFTDIDTTKAEITNSVTGKIHLETPEKDSTPVTDTHNTNLNFNINISATKRWEDNNNDKGKRPTAVDIVLKNGETEVERKEANAGNNWSVTFENLPKYDSQTHNEIAYKVTEEAKAEKDLYFYDAQVNSSNMLNQTITNTLNYASLIVHHYVEGTKEKVPSKNGEKVEDELIEGRVGDSYTTKPSEEIAPNYEHTGDKGDLTGQLTKEPQEVDYYYNYKDPSIKNTITKTGTQTMTTKEQAVDYTITYNAEVDTYRGDAVITIVDTLPYHIDTTQSQLGNGEYNENNKTITWTENVTGIDTFTSGKYTKEITKTLKLVFTDIDTTKEQMTNTVKGKISLKTPVKESEEATATHDTNLNFKINIKATKEWDDKENKAGKRPNGVIIVLKNGETQLQEKEANEENHWKVTFENLSKYDSQTREEIHYTVEEKEKKNKDLYFYTTSVDSTDMLNQVVTNTSKYAKVIVHHYIENTQTKVPAVGEGEVQDVILEDTIGSDYTTEISKDVSPNYEYVSRTENHTGKMKEDPIEVTYYYRLVDAEIDSKITKKATEKITKEDQEVTYEISYNVNIDKYIGNAKLKIVDYLPYEIDTQKSNLAEGTYDKETNSVTWTQEVTGINTYTNGQKNIVINKTIVVVYKNQDVTQNIVNNVEGEVELPVTEQKEKVNTQAETEQEYRLNVTVNKVWVDNEKQALRRPEKVKIELLANGEVIQNKEITTTENTSCTFTNVNKYDEKGVPIVYTVQEAEVNANDLYFYVNKVNSEDMLNQTITNTFKRPGDLIEKEVKKIWEDQENIYERRPESVKLLLKDEKGNTQEAIVNEGNQWKHTFTNLDKYDENGQEKVYVVDEVEVNEKDLYFYTKELNNEEYTVTNTFTVPEDQVQVKVDKIWEDKENKYGKRPESIKVTLYGDKKEVQSTIISEKEKWTYTFTNLRKYDAMTGREIKYTIEETEVEEGGLFFYKKAIDDTDMLNQTITNTFYVPDVKTAVNAKKIWKDKENIYERRPEAIEFILYSQGAEIPDEEDSDIENKDEIQGEENKGTEDGENSGTKSGETGEEGNNGEQSGNTQEQQDEGNSGTTEENKGTEDEENLGTTEENKGTEDGENSGTTDENKGTEDEENKETTDKEQEKPKQEVERKVVTQKENWEYIFMGLPKYNSVTGEEIKYTIEENEVKEKDLYFYTKEIDNENYTITNTFTVPDDRIEVQVTKEWLEDNNNEYEKRPDGIIAVLYADKEEFERYTLTEADEWKHTFTNLRKYNETTGKEIEYTIGEEQIKEGDLLYYDSKIEGYKITNTFKVTDVKVNSQIEKDGTEKITQKDQELNYTINYNTQIDGYIGNAEITITDTLPYQIDENKSDFAGGEYDKEKKTIIWKEKVDNVNTFKDGSKKVKISKQIKVVYKNIDPSKKSMNNKVEGKVYLDTTREENKVEAEKETQVDLRFNLKVEKSIKEVQKNGEADNVGNIKMHKISIHRKQTSTAKVKIKYEIKVTNTATLTGGGTIEEDLPGGMEFVKEESDARWYEEDGKVKAQTGDMEPGEEISLNIVTKWDGAKNSFGTLENKATITNTENEAGFEEEREDDNTDSAVLIIEIATGGKTYTIMAIVGLLSLIVITGVILVVKHTKEKNNG